MRCCVVADSGCKQIRAHKCVCDWLCIHGTKDEVLPELSIAFSNFELARATIGHRTIAIARPEVLHVWSEQEGRTRVRDSRQTACCYVVPLVLEKSGPKRYLFRLSYFRPRAIPPFISVGSPSICCCDRPVDRFATSQLPSQNSNLRMRILRPLAVIRNPRPPSGVSYHRHFVPTIKLIRSHLIRTT